MLSKRANSCYVFYKKKLQSMQSSNDIFSVFFKKKKKVLKKNVQLKKKKMFCKKKMFLKKCSVKKKNVM